MSVTRASLSRLFATLPVLVAVAALVTCVTMIDLKGISTDEGIRLGIINGGRAFTPMPTTPEPTYDDVLHTISPYAYQPAYYLLQNTLMRVTGRHNLVFFRFVNVAFYAICLAGLINLTSRWSPVARAFLVGAFAFNAYLIMHVLQIREYIAAVALYIWSTRLVLHLDNRPLEREWADIFWFLLYGLTITLAFYVQTWTVFPAIAQGVFLVFRRRPQLARFLAHLGFSYLTVYVLVWPYLQTNTQKVHVGLWASANVSLLSELHRGFNLVLAGQLPGHDRFSTLLPIAWIMLVLTAVGAARWWRQKLPEGVLRPLSRFAWLLLLSSAVTLTFQIAYFYKVEPLSVWPRYFVIHSFFLTTLVAAAFHLIATAWAAGLSRRTYTVVLAGAAGLLVVSAGFQMKSYWKDPYFDTSTSVASNWQVVARALNAILQPSDVFIAHDFITRSTLTATLPLPNRTLILRELETSDFDQAPRLVYLESALSLAERAELLRRMASRGYPVIHEWPVPAGDGSGPLAEWHILTFSRP